MQTLRQKQLLARWKDKAWRYHPSESHADASEFRARMRAYGQQDKEPATVREITRKVKA